MQTKVHILSLRYVQNEWTGQGDFVTDHCSAWRQISKTKRRPSWRIVKLKLTKVIEHTVFLRKQTERTKFRENLI